MNSIILDELYKNLGKYITSDKMCKKLGISRIAIWNRIKNLQKLGYKIEGKRSVGYILKEEAKDILIPYEIRRRLNTEIFGRRIEYFRLTSSTMDEAEYLIEKDENVDGAIVIAEEQTSGRGRQKRKWLSPQGENVYVSLIFKPKGMNVSDSIALMFAISIAIKEALSDFGVEDAKIKWPNDVMVNDKKIAGVLVETKSESGILSHAIIGFGINVNMEHMPDELKDKATSIKIETGIHVDRATLLSNILFYFENLIKMLDRDGKKAIFDLWRKYNNTLGRKVEVLSDKENFSGFAKDIDENGFLLVDIGGNIKKVITAESVRFVE
ncbi:biotin--[acetyl-CoA-carboxylase] ligase [Hippea maritima]|uniref:Bifunctional ligase/repressor BirA n=1 Tax=Hippea maritima (strain ATCC 700847 / DSM 10411 / MH2) TaxID=760142 RepID=F2LW79_HIPMA|nr:biotin--[acetyl-CoA-carboxylase] ligase [Hippea maritima]AEA34013.1 biotin/acetyl-CoA-carboxylase ligase [Hippea maritima DSM 10411]